LSGALGRNIAPGIQEARELAVYMHRIASSVDVKGSYLKPADIATVRRLLKSEGYAYITSISDEFEYLAELSRFGRPIPHHESDLVKDIKPDPRIETDTYSALSMQKLLPHTDWYESPGTPPRYVALWCIRASHRGGGETTLADGYSFLRRFSIQDQELMHERQYEWHGVPNISGGPPEAAIQHPILEHHSDGLIMRYSSRLLQHIVGDTLVSRYINDGAGFFAAEHISISITRNSVLLWDNWRMMHARNAFNDPERHLRRLLLAI
jgi:alpha-ketoglutarate-dependent taurine dioxygenase